MTNTAGTAKSPTILHVSDTQFGDHHRFVADDQSLADAMVVDLRYLLERDVPPIDLIVLSGDITERGLKSEFDQARRFLDALCDATGLNHDRIVVVPGNHDVNWPLCRAYFAECEGEETEPSRPYPRKWRHYRRFVTALHGETAFTEEQPYRLHHFDDLGLVVAAMNSTIAESHLDDGHYGWCGREQLRWFEAQLREVKDRIRLGVLHHNARRKATADNENLRDADDLTAVLGDSLDLLLHGHTHNGAHDRLSDGTLVLATGSAAVTADWRPDEAPNQYQILRVGPDRVTRWARQWDTQRRSWIDDTRISRKGDRWRVNIPFDVRHRFESAEPEEPRHGVRPERLDRPVRDFVSQVEYVTRRDVGGEADLDRRVKGDPPLDYLLVIRPAKPLRCVGIVDGRLTADLLDRFEGEVFQPLRERGDAELVIVHHGPQDPALREAGRDRGIRVKSWTEYNDLLDSSPYRDWLRRQLEADDQLYPQRLYLPQRYHPVNRWGVGEAIRDDLLSHLYGGVLEEDGQFFLILGEAGFGKSFLVRRLAYQLLARGPATVTPIVIYLRDRDKRQTIEEMVSAALIDSRTPFNPDRFNHSLEAGTLALLIDGYDEFAVRVGYQNAADQLDTFIRAQRGRAKILLTTRPNHFTSTHQVTSALFDRLTSVHHGRTYQLEPFDEEQQRAFLARWFELRGEPTPTAGELADRWMGALGRVDNLPELARTPRMLSFMVQDLHLDEIESAATESTVTAADLYQRLVDRWLTGEAQKVDPWDERTVSARDRQRLLEDVAFRLWQTGEQDLTETTLHQVAKANLDLPRIEQTVDQAAQLIGGRTLLKVDDRRWRFAHQSIFEFLLARHLAEQLRSGADLDRLGDAELTQLTIRFLRDLAPHEAAAWAASVVERPR